MKIFFKLMLLVSSFGVWADVNIDQIKKSVPSFQTIRIVKEKKIYFLDYRETGYIRTKTNTLMYNRDIKIPVKIELTETSGFGKSLQFLGNGDTDAKTGSFKSLLNLKYKDLFTTYSGTSTNVGILILGGGFTKMVANNGATLQEGNGSMVMIGPTGIPIGINLGITHINFEMNISTILRAVPVHYKLTEFVNGKVSEVKIDETRAESLDEVGEIDLSSTISI